MDAKVFDKNKLPSRHVTEGPERAPHRSYYYAMGLSKEQIHKPFVGVASAWNEAAPSAREALLSRAFTADIRYRDPIMQGEGHDGIAALIDGVQQQFSDFRFSLRGEPDGFGDAIRFSWSFGPADGASVFEGTDIGVIENGRLKSVTGFLDKAPAQ